MKCTIGRLQHCECLSCIATLMNPTDNHNSGSCGPITLSSSPNLRHECFHGYLRKLEEVMQSYCVTPALHPSSKHREHCLGAGVQVLGCHHGCGRCPPSCDFTTLQDLPQIKYENLTNYHKLKSLIIIMLSKFCIFFSSSMVKTLRL